MVSCASTRRHGHGHVRGKLHARVIRVDASDLFLGELAGVTDPEQKRKIIGRLFVDVFKAEAAKLKAGTGGHKVRPSSPRAPSTRRGRAVAPRPRGHHHQEPPQRRWPARKLGLKLLEPLRELFRTKCAPGRGPRAAAEMVYRHPFPGPGLGVRILGEVKSPTPICCAGPTPSSSRAAGLEG